MELTSVLSQIVHVLSLVVSHLDVGVSALQDFAGSVGFSFNVAADCDPCPGAQFTEVGAAWANIGYMTHSDFLHFVSESKFGLWAPLLYVAAAVGALVGVAIGVPPRTYMWFILGPAIYSFLINTTQEVKGVDWVVAGRPQDMTEVWRDAEAGLKNSELVKRLNITINKKDAPSEEYKVATAFLYLDELFSATANILIEWTGLYRQKGDGGNDSNLAKRPGEAEGPWYLLSNLKWGLLENMVGGTIRNPDLRDALITFLASECGEKFKAAISSGRYIAAAQSRGAVIPSSIMKQENETDVEFDGTNETAPQYDYAIQGLDVTSMPSPRSLVRLFNDTKSTGSFGKFAKIFDSSGAGGSSVPITNGRGQTIVCSEYLYTLVQALRWESGHAYWQLIRTSPRGLTREEFLQTLFYGWDIRENRDAEYAKEEELEAFVKQIIFTYILRNELLFAPQITSIDQRYAPSEQARSYSEAYVRTSGSKSKFAELFQWAVLMPHLQGILVYLLIIAYPFACMVMVLHGYWKAFFTWVSFFAWVKLWDVGFAMVQVLERSVWAMIGNHSNMERVANMLIQTAKQAGDVGVDCESGAVGVTKDLPAMCAVPRVCSLDSLGTACGGAGSDQSPNKAWLLLDRSLLIGSSIDLDLSNGYYIYIMAALYFAVPAVTGQLVLGAKAGASGMVNSMIGGVSGEAGRAAQTGYQASAVNAVQTNQGSLGQAAYAKATRQGGLAQQYLDTANQAMDREMESSRLGGVNRGLQAGASALESRSRSYGSATAPIKAGLNLGGEAAKFLTGSGTGGGTGGPGDKQQGSFWAVAGAAANLGMSYGGYRLEQQAIGAQVRASGQGLNNQWAQDRQNLGRSGLGAYGNKLQHQAGFEAESATWEAKNAFGAHASSQAGIAGMNAGNLSPGQKPQDMDGMAMNGMLGSNAESAARYSGTGFMRGSAVMTSNGARNLGSSWVNQNWGGGFNMYTAAGHAASSSAGAMGMRGPAPGTDPFRWMAGQALSTPGPWGTDPGRAMGEASYDAIGAGRVLGPVTDAGRQANQFLSQHPSRANPVPPVSK